MKIHRLLLISCLAALLVLSVVPTALAACGPGTVDVQVSTDADDAEECVLNGSVYHNSDLELVVDTTKCTVGGGLQEVGMRFQNISIPQGATITNAYVEFTAQTPRSGTTNLTFYAEDIDDAPVFQAGATSDITNRTKTLASVDWNNIPAWPTDGEKKQTPDLSSIIQEVVNRSGWASGNSLAVIVTGSGKREAYAHEGSVTNKAPLLHVEYAQGGGGGGGGGGFTPCNWGFRRKLTFDNSAQAENLVDFPVLVVLNSSRINYSQTQNAGEDLRFTDADGTTVLAHEIEQWNEAGTSYVWVKVPQIDASSSVDYIWMYYGNATALDAQDPTAVWSNGYAGVWHLSEPSNVTRADSTANCNNLTDINTVAGVSGKIAGAADFVSASSELLAITDAAQTGLNITGNLTLEAWVNVDDNLQTYDMVSKDGANGNRAYHLRMNHTRMNFEVSTDGTNMVSALGPSGTVVAGTWYYGVGVYDGGAVRVYRNDVQDASTAYSGGIPLSTADFNIGARNSNAQQMNGVVDEVRVSNVARSANWIKAQYKSMTDAFITYGGEEPPSSGVVVNYFSPDAVAAGMSVPVTFVGSFCSGSPTVTTSSSDIIVGPTIMTDATGAVVASNGTALSTVFIVKPSARPATGITVNVAGSPLSQTFDIVIPSPDPNVTSGTGTLSGRTKGGTSVLGGLTVGSGATLKISTSDTDGATAGNQGYLPATILVKGDVNIAGTLDVSGQDGTDGGSCTGGDGGGGAPGGGGGGGGGVGECGGGGGGSPAVDAVSTALVATGESFKIVPHTTTGTDRLMIVGVSLNNRNLVNTVTTVLYGGQILTRVGTVANSDDALVDLWRLIAPDTGNQNVVVTFNAGLDRSAVIGVITFTNVDQTTPLGTFASEIGTSGAANVWVSSATDELVLDVVSAETANSLTAWTGQTERWNDVAPSANDEYGGGSTKPGATSVLMRWGLGTSDHWAIGAVPIKPASGGGSSGTAAPGAAGRSGGGGGGSTGTGTGGAGGDGTGAAGAAASGTTGGNGGTALASATGGGGGSPNSSEAGGSGGAGGTGNPFGSGGVGGADDGGASGEGGGGGGAAGTTPGGGGGGAFATAGGRGPDVPDAGFGGSVTGNAQLVPLAGGSGGGGGGPDVDIDSRGGGGGGGGGAVLIYATGSVNVTSTGNIDARGSKGGNGFAGDGFASGGGGGGSGGAIFLQSGDVTVDPSATLRMQGETGGTSAGNAAGGAGGDGRIRIDGLASGSVPGTAGSKFIGPVIDKLVDKTVTGRADGGSTITLYVYDETGAQVTGSPYTATASGATGTVGTWTLSGVTFPSGTNYLVVKQSTSGGSVQVFGPGRATKGVHLINWREVY